VKLSNLPVPVNLDTVANNLADPLFLVNRDKEVNWLNKKSRELFRTSDEDAQGAVITELTGIAKLDSLLDDVFEQETELKCSYEEASVKVKRQDQRYFFKISINPISMKVNSGAAWFNSPM